METLYTAALRVLADARRTLECCEKVKPACERDRTSATGPSSEQGRKAKEKE